MIRACYLPNSTFYDTGILGLNDLVHLPLYPIGLPLFQLAQNCAFYEPPWRLETESILYMHLKIEIATSASIQFSTQAGKPHFASLRGARGDHEHK